jgi:hypothetical protein
MYSRHTRNVQGMENYFPPSIPSLPFLHPDPTPSMPPPLQHASQYHIRRVDAGLVLEQQPQQRLVAALGSIDQARESILREEAGGRGPGCVAGSGVGVLETRKFACIMLREGRHSYTHTCLSIYLSTLLQLGTSDRGAYYNWGKNAIRMRRSGRARREHSPAPPHHHHHHHALLPHAPRFLHRRRPPLRAAAPPPPPPCRQGSWPPRGGVSSSPAVVEGGGSRPAACAQQHGGRCGAA